MFASGKTDSQQEGAMSAQFSNIGFTVSHQRRSAVLAELIATVALIISIAVVATAVSMGIANAGIPFVSFG
jgi:hypothetical protein